MVLTVATGLQNGEFTGTPLTVDNMTGSYIDYPHGSSDSSMEHRERFRLWPINLFGSILQQPY